MDSEIIDTFAQFIKEERFDTESINDDVINQDGKRSNIINYVKDTSFSRLFAISLRTKMIHELGGFGTPWTASFSAA